MMEKLSVTEIVFHDIDSECKPHGSKMLITLYGQIRCGEPNFIDDYREAIIEIPQKMIGNGEFFALRAQGDSMIGAGIIDGDILIIKLQNYAENGQIVVARIGHDVTLKRYFKLDKKQLYCLHPENTNYDDIITDKCDIMGVAVKIIKDLGDE